jgi:hypothetical protein
MSAVTGYVLGYEDGRSAADTSRRNREIVDSVFYGQRTVEVDQSYLTQLQQLVEKFRADSDHNFDKADLFHREALEWKADAERHEARAAALQAQVLAFQDQLAERDAALGQADAALAQERTAHQTTHEEKWGLNLFRLIATWLINAHIAGRSDRPEFAEMRDMAKDVTDAIQRGEPFRGYRDEPQKRARLQGLLEELLRP